MWSIGVRTKVPVKNEDPNGPVHRIISYIQLASASCPDIDLPQLKPKCGVASLELVDVKECLSPDRTFFVNLERAGLAEVISSYDRPPY